MRSDSESRRLACTRSCDRAEEFGANGPPTATPEPLRISRDTYDVAERRNTMNTKKILALLIAGSVLTAGIPLQQASAQSLTAQSAQVYLRYDSTAYEINGTTTWTFDRAGAMPYYTNSWDGQPPAVVTGKGEQTSPGVPDAAVNDLRNFVQDQRCVFFNGGALNPGVYTQTVNGTAGWKWTYTFTITPTQPDVAAGTAWTAVETGGTVDVGFSGFVASESFLQNGTTNKYSFTLLNNGDSRVSGVSAQLQKQDGSNWVAVGDTLDLNNVDTDRDDVNDALAVRSTSLAEDYAYSGNAGVFGKSSVFGALHAPGYKAANWVSRILNGIADGSISDNFKGNNNDLTAGNVHQADFEGEFAGLSEPGSYRTVIAGTIKGNAGSANQAFSVAENSMVIGGCSE